MVSDKREFYNDRCDYIMPLSTGFTDLREKKNQKPIWDEDFFIDCPVDSLINKNSLILFEILDYDASLIINKNTQNINQEGMYRIAWGYLRPLGQGGIYIGRNKI